MAQFIIRNSLNPSKVVKLGITFRQVTTVNNEAETIWVVELNTNELDINGDEISPEFINLVTLDNFDVEVSKASAVIAEKIDWAPLIGDTSPPSVESYTPSDYEVSMDSYVKMVIEESLPSTGIDRDSITMTINGFDVSSDLIISGDPYSYTVKWKPPIKIYDTY